MEATVIEELPAASQVRVLISCQGACTANKPNAGAKWTGHIFLRLEPVARGQAMMYACTSCGAERRYGLLGLGASADDRDD